MYLVPRVDTSAESPKKIGVSPIFKRGYEQIPCEKIPITKGICLE